MQVELPLEKRGIGLVADRHEEAIDLGFRAGAGLDVLQPHRGDLALVRIQHVLHHRVPEEGDLGVLERALLHDLGPAQGLAPVHHVDFPAEAREVERLLEG